MLKKLLICSAGLLLVISCQKFDTGLRTPAQVKQKDVSIPITLEELGSETKTYLKSYPTYWTFKLEDGDNIDYFKYIDGEYSDYGSTTVSVGKNSTFIDFLGAGLQSGDVIYSYVTQPDFSEHLSYYEGIWNDDPENLIFNIPGNQITNQEIPYYTESLNCSFELTKIRFEQSQIKTNTSAQYNEVPKNSLSFRITNYNPELTYLCKTNPEGLADEKLSIDDNGNVTLPISFQNFTSSTTKKESLSFTIYVADYPEYENSAMIELSVARTKSSLYYTYTFSVGKPTYTSEMVFIEVLSQNPIAVPSRNAMPYVSVGTKISNYSANHPEYIGESITYYMLGSAFEFKIFSSNTQFSEGEQIESVTLSTTTQCGGRYTYSLPSESLVLKPIPEYAVNEITSDISECCYNVPSQKTNAVSTYVVIAPGTYSGKAVIETTHWIHTFNFSNKTLTRAYKLIVNADLNSSNATHVKKTTGETYPGTSIDNWNESNENDYEF